MTRPEHKGPKLRRNGINNRCVYLLGIPGHARWQELPRQIRLSSTSQDRRSPRIEKHYVELQRDLANVGFGVQTDVHAQTALDKYPDGTSIAPPEPVRITDQSLTPFRRKRF